MYAYGRFFSGSDILLRFKGKPMLTYGTVYPVSHKTLEKEYKEPLLFLALIYLIRTSGNNSALYISLYLD